jgi:uncharacterized protein (DUF58 family)
VSTRQPPPGTRGWERQVRPTLGSAGALVVTAVAWNTWRATGSRLALFVCFAPLAALGLDLAWAVVSTRRVRATVDAIPTDAYVGDVVPFTLSLAGPALPFHVRAFPDSSFVVGEPSTSGRVVGFGERREVVTEVVVEVVGTGLSGLVACARRLPTPLPHPLAVGPRPLAPAHPFPELFGAWGDGAPRPAPVGDVVRGVRDYVPGDPAGRVHWPSTARRGDLVVKEVEEPGAPRLIVVLDLGGGGDGGEKAAARAAWYAYEGLRRGYVVVLATAEQAGPVTAAVGPASEVNHRLARAARGRPHLPSEAARGRGRGPAAVVTVTPSGDSWPS